jgi:MFS family permease
MAIRGRVMSLYILVLLGGQSIGGPLMGWLVEVAGAHVGMIVSGGVPALAAGLIGLRFLLVRRRRTRAAGRRSGTVEAEKNPGNPGSTATEVR